MHFSDFAGEKLFDSCAGGILLGTLFTGADTAAHDLAVDTHLDGEFLIVIRAGFTGKPVDNLLVFLLLDQLLQSGLIVLIL